MIDVKPTAALRFTKDEVTTLAHHAAIGRDRSFAYHGPHTSYEAATDKLVFALKSFADVASTTAAVQFTKDEVTTLAHHAAIGRDHSFLYRGLHTSYEAATDKLVSALTSFAEVATAVSNSPARPDSSRQIPGHNSEPIT